MGEGFPTFFSPFSVIHTLCPPCVSIARMPGLYQTPTTSPADTVQLFSVEETQPVVVTPNWPGERVEMMAQAVMLRF